VPLSRLQSFGFHKIMIGRLQFHNSPPHRRLKTLFHDSVQQASGSLGDKIADLRLVLFVRCLRCEIGDEVLEARIIPERIEQEQE
jgi:hypothetical protein